jgi:hypothetical protein
MVFTRQNEESHPQVADRPSKPGTTTEATEAFLAQCKNCNIADPTYRKYKTFCSQLKAYSEARGYLNMDQLTVSDMDRFYAGWRDGIHARPRSSTGSGHLSNFASSENG